MLRIVITAPLLLALAACESPKDEETGPTESPYEMPSRAGCSYELVYDEGADGTDDWSDEIVWDADERVVDYTHESPADAWTRHIAYEYDAAGCMVGYTFEDDQDGYVSQVTAVSSCDGHGNAVEATYTQSYGGDAPDVITYTYTNTYDGDLLVEKAVAAAAEGMTFTLHPNRYTYGYDADGRLDAEDAYDDDGWMWGETATWLAEDKPLTTHYEDADGATRDAEYTYDEHDRNVASTFVDVASGGTEASRDEARAWDPDHYRVTTSRMDVDRDGTLDAESTSTYDGGWPWTAEVEVDGRSTVGADDGEHDGTADHRYRYGYTCG